MGLSFVLGILITVLIINVQQYKEADNIFEEIKQVNSELKYEIGKIDLQHLNFTYIGDDFNGMFLYRSNESCGYYDVDEKKIYLNVNRTMCYDFSKTMLHELKHHWCWTNEREETLNISRECTKQFKDNRTGWQGCIHKQGCFLDTPIDREFGFIN